MRPTDALTYTAVYQIFRARRLSPSDAAAWTLWVLRGPVTAEGTKS